MKRYTLSVVITGVLGLAAYTFAGAQGPGRGPGFGPGLDGPGGGFGRGAGMALRGLELSEEQREQIKAIRLAEHDAQGGPAADLQVHAQLQAEIFSDAPDPQKVAALQQQVLQAQAERLARRVALEQKIAEVLTAEQKAQVRERLARTPRGRRGGVR